MNYSVLDLSTREVRDIVFRRYGDQGFRIFLGDEHIGMAWHSLYGGWRAQTMPTVETGSKVVDGFRTRRNAMEYILQELGLHPWMAGHEWDDVEKRWVDPVREDLARLRGLGRT